MKLSLLSLIGVAVLLLGCNTQPEAQPGNSTTVFPAPLEEVEEQAAFGIYINGLPLDLTLEQYVDQDEDIFLRKPFPNIVFIKKSPLTWEEFLATLPIKVEDNCLSIDIRSTYCNDDENSIKLYLNKTPIASLEGIVINNGDKLLISYGDEVGIELDRQYNKLPRLEQ